MRQQPLVFRTAETQPVPELPSETTFVMVANEIDALRIAPSFAKRYGLAATAKMLAKLATPSRRYYAVLDRGRRILSDGWITLGRCRLYEIGKRDCVIGPIATSPTERGRGLAHASLVRGINDCLSNGCQWVYIDTTEDNLASRRVIAKSGMQPL